VDIAAWLRDLKLEQYERVFLDNAIDTDTLPELSEADFEKLGVLLGHRKRLLKAIAALRERAAADAGPAVAAPTTGSPEGERRQVTVLFADLCGFTRLSSELDAEDLHALTDRFFDVVDRVIERYGGMVDKHIGDCVMAVFGAPVAHGDDPERAVRAALDVHASMLPLSEAIGRPLRVHIGLASGQVVACGTGAGRRAYTVTGETVNLASRLADAAGPEEILVSEAVHGAVAARVVSEEVGNINVRGFDRTVRVWRVRSMRSSGATAPGRPLVGRRAELQQFGGRPAGMSRDRRGARRVRTWRSRHRQNATR
jgi:class 3 adenylate cyclase